MFYLHQTPSWLQKILPAIHWRVEGEGLCLSFDDGPDPELTPWVLDLLDIYQTKALFFCVGENAQRYPELIKAIQARGHRLGNHTHRHLDAWRTSTADYLADVQACAAVLPPTKLFRPPYGRILPGQYRALRQAGFEVVLWDVLTGDFDVQRPVEACLEATLKASRPGSILVFHDNIRFNSRLRQLLPDCLAYFKAQNWLSQTCFFDSFDNKT